MSSLLLARVGASHRDISASANANSNSSSSLTARNGISSSRRHLVQGMGGGKVKLEALPLPSNTSKSALLQLQEWSKRHMGEADVLRMKRRKAHGKPSKSSSTSALLLPRMDLLSSSVDRKASARSGKAAPAAPPDSEGPGLGRLRLSGSKTGAPPPQPQATSADAMQQRQQQQQQVQQQQNSPNKNSLVVESSRGSATGSILASSASVGLLERPHGRQGMTPQQPQVPSQPQKGDRMVPAAGAENKGGGFARKNFLAPAMSVYLQSPKTSAALSAKSSASSSARSSPPRDMPSSRNPHKGGGGGSSSASRKSSHASPLSPDSPPEQHPMDHRGKVTRDAHLAVSQSASHVMGSHRSSTKDLEFFLSLDSLSQVDSQPASPSPRGSAEQDALEGLAKAPPDSSLSRKNTSFAQQSSSAMGMMGLISHKLSPVRKGESSPRMPSFAAAAAKVTIPQVRGSQQQRQITGKGSLTSRVVKVPTRIAAGSTSKHGSVTDRPATDWNAGRVWKHLKLAFTFAHKVKEVSQEKRFEVARQTVEEGVAQRKLVHARPEDTPNVVFAKQVNLDMYSQEAMLSRQRIRASVELREVFKRWWAVTDTNYDGVISMDEYARFFTKLLLVLEPDFTQRALRRVVQGEWEKDCRGLDHITWSMFFDASFELVDHWTLTSDEADYIRFARETIQKAFPSYERTFNLYKERAEVVRRKRTKILMEKKQYMSDKRNAMSFHNKHNRRRREKMLHGVYAQISPRTKPTKAAKEGTVESSAAACPLTSVQENCAPSTSVPSLDSDSYRQLVDGGYSDLEEVLSDGETDNLDTESAAWSPSSSSDGDAVVPIHNMVAKVPPSPPQSPDESSLEASH